MRDLKNMDDRELSSFIQNIGDLCDLLEKDVDSYNHYYTFQGVAGGECDSVSVIQQKNGGIFHGRATVFDIRRMITASKEEDV